MVKIDKDSRSYKITLCAMVTLLLAVLIISNYSIFFYLDDIGMRNIVSGLTTGTPDAHTYFIFYPLSSLLAALYTMFPNVYWYLILFLVANYLCLFLLLYRVLQLVRKHHGTVLIITTGIFLILWLPNLLLLEWTATAGILAACAIFWYGTMPLNMRYKRAILEYAIPVILLFFAFNMRYMVTLMSVPFAGIVALSRWHQNKGHWKKCYLRREFLFCAIAVLVVGGSYLTHKIAYGDERWQERDDFSTYRSQLFDYYGYPDYEEYRELYEQCGITKEMLDCLKEDGNFMLAATGVLSAENLEPIATKAKELYFSNTTLKDKFIYCVEHRAERMFHDSYRIYTLLFYGLFIVGIIIAIKRKDWLQLIINILAVISLEFMWFYLYYKGRAPIRVGYALYITAIVGILVIMWKRAEFRNILKNKIFQIAAVLIISILFGTTMSTNVNDNIYQTTQSLTRKIVKEYCEFNSENIYIRDLNSFLMQYERIQDRDEMAGINYRPYNDWTCGMPLDCPVMPLDGSVELCNWISKKNNIYLLVDSTRANAVTLRQEALFRSRGIQCDLQLNDEMLVSNGTIIQVYRYVCY